MATLTPAQLTALRNEYANIQALTPKMRTTLVRRLSECAPSQLSQLATAHIAHLSELASPHLTESVTNYAGTGLGGNRKAILSKLRAATTKQQQSDLATQARKAGASQMEIKNASKALTELSDKVLTSYEKRAQHQKQVATDVANRPDTDPRTWIKATNFAGRRDQGIRRATAKRSVSEDANGAEYFDRWEDWKAEVRKVGGETEHSGHGRYTAIGIDGESFGTWDETTGDGYIDYESNGQGSYMGSNDSLGESSPTDGDTETDSNNPRNIEKEEPAAPKLDWVSKFDLGEIKEAMQKIVDHLADTDDMEQTDLLRNDIRVLDNLHDALRKQDGELVKKCWEIAKSEGSAEHLHDEFQRRMDDTLKSTSSVRESYVSETMFRNKAKWTQAAKKYRVKDTGKSITAYCKETGQMMGRWSGEKGWIEPV